MWVWYHYIGGDYRLRLNCCVTCTMWRQTSCHGELMGWCVTSEMRAKIRPADWRRAPKMTGGISWWAGPRGSRSWSVDVTEDGRMFDVESEPYINMEWMMLPRIYDRRKDLLNGWMWCQYNANTMDMILCNECTRDTDTPGLSYQSGV